MSLGTDLLPEWDQEMLVTRRIIERVPSEKGEWKPHPKSFSLAHLTQLVAGMPGWIVMAITQPELDLKSGGGYSTQSTETLLQEFDKNAAAGRKALEAAKRFRLQAAVVAQDGRPRTDDDAEGRGRATDNQSPVAPSGAAHGVPAAPRCAGAVDLRTDGRRKGVVSRRTTCEVLAGSFLKP